MTWALYHDYRRHAFSHPRRSGAPSPNGRTNALSSVLWLGSRAGCPAAHPLGPAPSSFSQAGCLGAVTNLPCFVVFLSLLPDLHGVYRLSANQGPYLASGDQSLERATGEHASVHEYPGELGQPPGLYPSSHPPGRAGTLRALSRQDTFDADTPGNRNSAYTELGDSCVDMETDPSEGPGLGDPSGASTPPVRQGSWEDEEEDYEEELTDNRNRGRNKARYCAEGGGPVLGRNKNELEGWGRGVYIR